LGEFFAKDAIEDGGFAGGNAADETDIDVVNRDGIGVHFILVVILLSLKGSAIEKSIFCVKKTRILVSSSNNAFTTAPRISH
jgi:hypothetical protein